MAAPPTHDPAPPDSGKAPSFIQMVGSVLAAFFGVQSKRNRERDFKHGRAGVFIFIGVAMTVLFILAVWLAVKLTLKHAGM